MKRNEKVKVVAAIGAVLFPIGRVRFMASLKIGVSQFENVMTVSANTPSRHDFVLKSALMTV
jgi:hypothetical protein